MDTIEKAWTELDTARIDDDEGHYDAAQRSLQRAMAYAVIAQAEQMKRLVDKLDELSEEGFFKTYTKEW